MSPLREKYDYCPDEYRCRYYEIAVSFHTSKDLRKQQNKIIWTEVR
jgi:hypothetical protein